MRDPGNEVESLAVIKHASAESGYCISIHECILSWKHFALNFEPKMGRFKSDEGGSNRFFISPTIGNLNC